MLRRSTIMLVVALAVLPSIAYSQKGSLYMCRATRGIPRSPRSTVYTTEILPVNGVAYADILRAWQDYMKKTDENASYAAECFTGDQPLMSQSVANGLAPWQGAKMVATGWKYGAGMTATPSKPGAVYAWCNSGTFGGDKTVYDTQVFEIGTGDAASTQSPVETAFTNYLISKKQNKYIFSQWFSKSVACPHSYGSRTLAEEARVKFENQSKAGGISVVATGWIYPRNLINNTPAPNSH